MANTRIFEALCAATLVAIFLIQSCPAQQKQETRLPTNPGTDWADAKFWTTRNGNPVQENWKFKDGEVQLIQPAGRDGHILSPPLSSNFDLTFQWKIENGTNSGVKYRVRKYEKFWLGLEYQIIDPARNATGSGSTAAIYDLVEPAAELHLLPPGQWNQSRIVANGHRLEHSLNGSLVASTTTSGPDWDRRFAFSKYWGNEEFGSSAGDSRIMLTDHGGKVAFRNFQFTALTPPDAQELPTATAPYFGDGMRNSWADQNSIVLWTRTTAHPNLLAQGLPFVNVKENRLVKSRDAKYLLAAQLPAGATLDQMFGACPGAAGKIRLTYFSERRRNSPTVTDWITTSAESDFTAQWKLENLKPGHEYAAIIEATQIGSDEITSVIRGSFRTAPALGDPQSLKFCVTTCHDFIRRDDGLMGHKIYPSMTALDPEFVVHAGDIEYYDKPAPYACTLELMRFKWARIFALPNNRTFYQNTTSYFIKDDHDTLKNDCWPGQRYGSVSFDEGVKLFNEEQFPSRSTRYQTVRWGRDLQIWILEGRDFRSPNNLPDGPDKTILGSKQKAWLRETLSQSDAKFKLVFSPTPIVGPDREHKKDNHANDVFEFEGRELRTELAKHEGVIVLCGDRHWQYASVDKDTQLWEFGCGPGSEKHEFGWKAGDQRPVHRFLRVDGGFLAGEITYSDWRQRQAQLTLRHCTVTGEPVSKFVFPITDPATEPTVDSALDWVPAVDSPQIRR